MRYLMMIISISLLAFAASGCGSSSDDSSGGRSRAKTSVKMLKTYNGKTLGAVQISISIPYGVTVTLDPLTQEPAKDVVQLIGVANQVIQYQGQNYSVVYETNSYKAATPTTPGSLDFTIINVNGFGDLEYIAIQLDLTDGFTPPTKQDIGILQYAVADIVDYAYVNVPATDYTYEVTPI